MYFQALIAVFASLSTLTGAAPSPTEGNEVVARVQTEYPAFVTDTTNQQTAFFVHVSGENPAYTNRNLQLRPDPSVSGATIVVVDSWSPVLALQMRHGSLYSEAQDQLKDLGPVGGLRNISTNAATGDAEQAFVFRNLKGAGPSFRQSQGGWQLVGGGQAATYNLYHVVPDGIVNGFIICKKSQNGDTYYQLFYQQYVSEPPSYPGCDFVGLETVLAPPFP